jgi:MtN3 and saliva related transmembrane protein
MGTFGRSGTRRLPLSNGEILGYIGGALTTSGFVPQVVRVLKLKSAHEISLPFTLLFLSGMIFWLAYGIYLSLSSVILWNALSVCLGSVLLYAKLKYGR